jgi:hypothetical protein
MSVKISFYNLVIPIRNVDKVYDGGFEKFKIDKAVTYRFSFDDNIVLFGAMNFEDIEPIADYFVGLGLIPFFLDENEMFSKWVDLIIFEQEDLVSGIKSKFNPIDKCNWLDYDNWAVYYIGN